MQALMLAAGMGRRLGPYTQDNTKCMLSVDGVRLIDRVCGMLAKKKSIRRLVMVVGYHAQHVIDYLTPRYAGVLQIDFIRNDVYDKTNNIYSLALAKDELCKDDTLLLESDLIFDEQVIDSILNHSDKDLALVAKYESWMDGTMVTMDEERNIVSFVPKEAFRFEDVDTYYKTVNIYKFSRDFSRNCYVPFLEAYVRVMGNNEYYEQVLRVLQSIHRSPLKALPIGAERWYEIDDIQDLDIASCIFAEGNKRWQAYHHRFGGYWRFPQMLDYCYLVNPYFPTSRMREELKSNFEACLTAYPSGMYVNSLLAARYFGVCQESIVVGNGAAELIKVVMELHDSHRIGIVFPTFDEYPNRLRPEQIVPYIVEHPDLRYTAEDLIRFFSAHPVRVLLLVNPDNPSGNYIPRADVLTLAQWCTDQGVRLIVDESFVDFVDVPGEKSLMQDNLLAAYPTMVVMKSISKSYGVPGLRLGVLASADRDLMAQIKQELPIWNINSVAEAYLQIYSKYEAEYARACDLIKAERKRFQIDLGRISYLRVMPSESNYFLCEVTQKFTSAELARLLIERNVLIADCSLKQRMQGRPYVRIAVRNRPDNERLVAILQALESYNPPPISHKQ